MSTVVKKDTTKAKKVKQTRFRITLSSTKLRDVEQACKDLVRQAKINKTKLAGPTRMPVKVLRVVVRRSPSGQGTATFETYKMKIFKRVIDVTSQADVVKKITSIRMAASVDVVISLP
eukprot:UN00765